MSHGLRKKYQRPTTPEREARRAKLNKVMSKTGLKRIAVDIPAPMHAKFKVLCTEERQLMRNVLLDLVAKYIETQGESLNS